MMKEILNEWRKYLIKEDTETEKAAAANPTTGPAPVEKKVAFSGEAELAKTEFATKKQYGIQCPLAKAAQNKIKEKINLTDPNIIKKLSDGRMGYITATLINYAIEYGITRGMKTTLNKIQLSPQGYKKACASSKTQIQEIVNTIGVMPIGTIEEIVLTPEQRREEKIARYQKAPPVIVPIRDAMKNLLASKLTNPNEAEKYANTIMYQYFPAKLRSSGFDSVEDLTPKAIQTFSVELVDKFVQDFPGIVKQVG